MAQTGITILPRRIAVLPAVVEQLQPRASGKGKVEDVKITAIYGLKLLEPEDAPVEIERFLDVGAIDGDVFYLPDFQVENSMDEGKEKPKRVSVGCPFDRLENFPLGNFGGNKDLEQVRILAQLMQRPFQVFQRDFHGEQRFRIDPAICDHGNGIRPVVTYAGA